MKLIFINGSEPHIKKWESKAKANIRIGNDTSYSKAMAYCDCIQAYTKDLDQWDCYDRLQTEVAMYGDEQ
tara:strand:- start:448 stop:657 length:210 start_codon:yes stop_codon:yes gene_type:complete